MAAAASAPPRVLVAMSGGVDSSVAAYLLRERGYDCTGATMRLVDDAWLGEVPPPENGCCSLADVEDARAVCATLGIPHYTFNLAADFEAQVVAPFVAAYQRGETPNPCIDCNRFLKFEQLLARALTLGYDYIATGHYARRVEQPPFSPPTPARHLERSSVRSVPHFSLYRGLDPDKDQSYVLYALTQAQLAHTLFPLGELTKAEVRAIAATLGLATAKKPESQDICFVPDGDYAAFIRRFADYTPAAGPIYDTSGRQIGTHDGLVGFTVGQRKGLGVAVGHPLFVQRIDVARNALIVGEKAELFSRRAELRELNLIAGRPLDAAARVTAKHRYRSCEQSATLTQTADDTAELVFDDPQKAITPGQALVFYQGEECLGGGTISAAGAAGAAGDSGDVDAGAGGAGGAGVAAGDSGSG